VKVSFPHLVASFAAVVTLLLVCGAGETPKPNPQAEPEIYGAGLFSTGQWDFFIAFFTDQRRALFCRANDDFTSYQIYETRLDSEGHWGAPTIPRFAGSWSNADPHISLDGLTVFYISNRPGPGETRPQATMDIWYATLGPDGEWGDGQRVPAPISVSGVDDWSPSVAANGNLYFGTQRPGGRGANDLWVARRLGDAYEAPVNLGDSINTPAGEVEPWIAPDESYLIFSGRGRKDGIGGFDIYSSRRDGAAWRKAQLVGSGVNTKALDFNPSVSPDGKWLYFSSTRPHTGPVGERFDSPRSDSTVAGIGNGKGDIYRVPLSVIEGR
jgi:Tol biopolymer transport system component